MLERIAAPEMPIRDILLDCTLVVRDSCGANEPAPGVGDQVERSSL
jgi:hypothetical protein